ncbi:MAG: hypothetical protein JWM27_966 [Gemmatimonadetes bacterium]|nr:hypothetical protein [Gemmatimonadota bacterium]
MFFTTVARVVVAEEPSRAVPGVKVSLFDRDSITPDDLLGTGTTGAEGEVRFDYNSKEFVDLDDRLGGVFPELFAVVYGPDDQVMVSTRADAVDNTPRKQLTVSVPRDLLERHGLLG